MFCLIHIKQVIDLKKKRTKTCYLVQIFKSWWLLKGQKRSAWWFSKAEGSKIFFENTEQNFAESEFIFFQCRTGIEQSSMLYLIVMQLCIVCNLVWHERHNLKLVVKTRMSLSQHMLMSYYANLCWHQEVIIRKSSNRLWFDESITTLFLESYACHKNQFLCNHQQRTWKDV